MKQTVVLVVGIILLSSCMTAQELFQDVIYLKNGDKLVGMILKQLPCRDITLQLEDQSERVVGIDSIEYIQKEKLPVNGWLFGKAYGRNFSFTAIVKAGKVSSGGDVSSTFQGMFGALYNKQLSLGLGVGYELASNFRLVPFFLDVRVYLLEARITPVIFADIGMSLGKNDIQEEWDTGGSMIALGGGFKISLTPGFALLVELAYRRQTIVEVYQDYGFQYDIISHSYVSYAGGVKKGQTKELDRRQLVIGIQF